MTAEIRQFLADPETITALKHADRSDHHRIPEIIQRFRAEGQQFLVAEVVRAKAEQLQPCKAMVLTWMMQTVVHDAFRHFGTPAGECFKNA